MTFPRISASHWIITESATLAVDAKGKGPQGSWPPVGRLWRWRTGLPDPGLHRCRDRRRCKELKVAPLHARRGILALKGRRSLRRRCDLATRSRQAR